VNLFHAERDAEQHILSSDHLDTVQGVSMAPWLNPIWSEEREAELLEFYGGNGLAVVQKLHTLDKYKDLLFDGRLHGYDFRRMTTLAVCDGKEVRKRTKEFMTSLINEALQHRQIVFPAKDLELEDQFATHTYTLRDGRVIYSKGNDHIIDTVRCALLARGQVNLDQIGEETVFLQPVLTDSVFL